MRSGRPRRRASRRKRSRSRLAPKTKEPSATDLQLFFRLTGALAPENAGLLTACRLAPLVAASVQFDNDQFWKKLKPQDRLKLRDRLLAIQNLMPLAFDRDLLQKLAQLPGKKMEEPFRTFVMGEGNNYFLQPTITTQGGGISRMLLPQFEAADEEGRPVYTEHGGKREKAPLELIREDPFYASYLLYHYADPQDEETVNPLLGQVNWKVEPETNLKGKVQKVVLSYDKIPGYETTSRSSNALPWLRARITSA